MKNKKKIKEREGIGKKEKKENKNIRKHKTERKNIQGMEQEITINKNKGKIRTK